MVDTVEQPTGAENIIWDLNPLYSSPTDPAIDEEMNRTETLAQEFVRRYRGKVAELTAAQLAEAMQALETIYELVERLGSYAYLVYSTNTADPEAGMLMAKAQEFGSKVGQQIVFFELEWNAVADERAAALLADPALAFYRHHLESERRYKPYKLDEAIEQVMMEKDVTGRQAWVRFFMQLTGSMRYEYDGEQVTQSEILSKLYSPDREVRRKAADSVTAGLQSRAMELTYIFNTLVSDKAIEDRRRSYPTWITSRNLDNKAPDEVVEALINTVTSNYDLVARHYNLKRALLDVDELTDYDRYAPLPIEEGDRLYPWDEARDIVLNAFSTFRPEMRDVANRFFEGNWIHAKLTPNKTGGAYASPVVPSVHPYVFLNYTGKARDVATLAHELGHGIHMYLSGQKVGLFGMNTPLTTAEMASVFAEMLVFNDLMKKEPDPAARLAMLAAKIEDTFATVFRQIAMNRFEDALHTARRSEGELTTERLNNIWMETQRAMFQDSVNLRDDYGIWWSYVGHFLHTPGYVYAYAFGELLVLALFNLYQEQGEAFASKYIDVLAAGNSDWPDRILAEVGVDLNDPAFWQRGLDAIEAMVAQEEALAREVYPERFQ